MQLKKQINDNNFIKIDLPASRLIIFFYCGHNNISTLRFLKNMFFK